MVQPGQHAGHRHSVLSRASAADAARTQDDHRRRGRHRSRMHAHPAPRGRPCDAALLSAAPPPPLAATVRPSSKRYPRYYRPNPASRNFVQHLRLWYAQSHPDEDFAETFAVWLTPRSNWRKRYAGWPALKKLEYVDELMAEIAGKRPLLTRRERGRSAQQAHRRRSASITRRSSRTIRSIRRATYDRDLLPHLLGRSAASAFAEAAASFIRHNRANIRELVSKWTGEYQLTLDPVLDDMIAALPRAEAARGRIRAAAASPTSPCC